MGIVGLDALYKCQLASAIVSNRGSHEVYSCIEWRIPRLYSLVCGSFRKFITPECIRIREFLLGLRA